MKSNKFQILDRKSLIVKDSFLNNENIKFYGLKDSYIAFYENKIIYFNKDIEVLNDFVIKLKKEGFKTFEILCKKDDVNFFKQLNFKMKEKVNEDNYLFEKEVDSQLLGETFKVIVDNPYGSIHAYLPDTIYEINSGYIEFNDFMQEAYISSLYTSVDMYDGYLIGIIRYKDKDFNRWIINESKSYDKTSIINDLGHLEMDIDLEIEWFNG